jgi:GTP diphosphokinase / guanosine-3',5'-bis(diphosphate) 3'-diphosphatase
MREKHAGFAQVSDIFGFRLVVPTLSDCYLALGVLHQLYKPVPGRFKDYIAIPKANGYQSLHTTLVSPLGTAVEFQMRTEAMHAVAEKGIAAHWLYKVGDKGQGNAASRRAAPGRDVAAVAAGHPGRDARFGRVPRARQDRPVPRRGLRVHAASKILALPRGATPVDFAYAIHSDVGDHTVAAKVNGEPVSLRTELQERRRGRDHHRARRRPNPAWLNMVRTGRARSKIRHYLKNMEQEESRALGEKMLAQALRAEGLSMPGSDPTDERRPQPVAAADALERQPQPRRPDGGHRLGRKIAIIVAKRLAQLMIEHGIRPTR